MIERDELGAWLRLLETPGSGRESARKLLAAFGSPEAVIAATTAARREVVGSAAAKALAESTDALKALIALTWEWLIGPSEHPRGVIPLGDPAYPALLLETADPPVLLYTLGRIDLLAAESIAIVGSRNPTVQGLENARAFGRNLAEQGFTIVSGLALGVDGAAHAGALDAAGGTTIAVVGTGLDRVYPRRHLDLARRIAAGGLIVSEYSIGTPPLGENFPQRNRIIAGLARGTLVVEAALRSGSLITARMASEAGREVFAIPGSIHSPQVRGCHALIRQGAKLVETAQDVLEELRLPGAGASCGTSSQPADDDAPDSPAGSNADPILAALGFDPVSLDALVARTGWPASELNIRLLELEMDGQVARLPGQLFQRIALA